MPQVQSVLTWISSQNQHSWMKRRNVPALPLRVSLPSFYLDDQSRGSWGATPAWGGMSHWWLLKKGVPFLEGRLATLRLPMHAPVDNDKSHTCGYHQLDSIDILKQKEDMKLGKRWVVKDPGKFRGREWEANKSPVHKF